MSNIEDDIEDLVGTPRDPVEDEIRARRAARMASRPILVEEALQGVTVSWLAQVFNMDPKTVKSKLADCPPLHRRKAGFVYSLPQACQYLVKPAMSLEQMLRSAKAADLPNHLQASFWDGALKRQKWEENAGDLWRTEKVVVVLGEVFQSMKFTMQLWVDTLDRQTTLSSEQRRLVIRLVDELQSEIHQALVKRGKETSTPSQLGELEEMIKVADDEDLV